MKRFLTIMGTVVATLLVMGFGAFAFGVPTSVTAQTDDASGQTETSIQRTINVSGIGQVEAQPDQAIVNLGVETEAETAAEALNINSAQMSDVISATLDAGIAEEDVQTQGLSLRPIYDSSEPEAAPTITGYRASNIVQITVRELDMMGTLLDTIVAAGGNTINNIRFTVSNRAEQETAAREAAMNNARQKAEQLASLADVELGLVIEILETGSPNSAPVAFAAQESVGGGVPIQAGTEVIEARVQVTWELQ